MTESVLLREVRIQSGMSQTEFAKYFGIPKKTLQGWEQNQRNIPEYLLRLMIYRLENEDIVKGMIDKLDDNE